MEQSDTHNAFVDAYRAEEVGSSAVEVANNWINGLTTCQIFKTQEQNEE